MPEPQAPFVERAFIDKYAANTAPDYWEVAEDRNGQILEAEKRHIEGRRAAMGVLGLEKPTPGGQPSGTLFQTHGLAGLALSGGGIRSATFSLGILQFLASKDLLKHFDYMSTVSGGGYVGSALTWFLYGKHGLGSFDLHGHFPFGTDSPRPSAPAVQQENAQLDYLRYRGNYLNPDEEITLAAGAALVLRAALLNLLVWVPIFAATFCVVVAAIWLSAPYWIGVAAAAFAGTPLEKLAHLLNTGNAIGGVHLAFATFVPAFTWLLVGVLLFGAYSLYYSRIASRASRDAEEQYGARRRLEGRMGVLLLVGILLPAVLASLPVVHQWIAVKGAMALIGGGGGAGIWSFAQTRIAGLRKLMGDDKESAVPIGLVAGIGAALLLYGVALLCFSVAIGVFEEPLRAIVLGVFLVGAILTGRGANINMIGLHRFYRDRLMEAFLPDRNSATTSMAAEADKGFLKDMPPTSSSAAGPYHLINTNIVIVNSSDRERRLRGGENFILSPLYCGSDATGWRSTKEYLGGFMSIATAMAISGAAANPNAASGGVGLTRSPAVATLMSLLNARLGYFVPHPDPEREVAGKKPNHFTPGFSAALAAIVGQGSDEERDWLQLSDGAHFDNTGLYELMRRKAQFVLACDGSSDPGYLFSDLVNALERARADFKIHWKINAQATLNGLMPATDLVYPQNRKRAEFGYAVISIGYADGSVGLVIYMTTTLVADLGEGVLGYCAENPAFPDQTTADQFFDERQFEAYRTLGWCIAEQMQSRTGLRSEGGSGSSYLVVPRAALGG